jgi:hypothetical protein
MEERVVRLEVQVEHAIDLIKEHMEKEEADRVVFLKRLSDMDAMLVKLQEAKKTEKAYIAGIGTGLAALWFLLSEVLPHLKLLLLNWLKMGA